jgi:uncharacterized protein (DUF58 family)
MVPTGRLVLIAALASAVVLMLPVASPYGLVIVNAALLAAAVIDGVLATAPRLVEVERRLPGGLTIGVEGQVRWRVSNPTSRRLSVAVADELAPSLRATTRRIRLRLPPGGSVGATAQLSPTRRGRFEPDEVVVRVEGPMGLAARQGRRHLPGVLRVLPPFRSRKEAELRIERARLLEVGLRSAQGRGGGTEFDSLREYSVDDELRRMDWAATARTTKPIVRTYRSERNQQVIAMLDNGRVMAGQVGGVPRLEWGMDAVMMLTAIASRLGDRCGLVTFDREVRGVVPPGSGTAQLTRVTEAMYDLEPRLVESDYRGAFAATLGRFRRRALLVLVTELAEEAVTETLVPALPLLLGRHLVIVASVVDPDVLRWAEEAPNDARAAFRSAAAVAALARRARTAARLRGLGVTVVDAPPSLMSARLADAYLKIKATGRL